MMRAVVIRESLHGGVLPTLPRPRRIDRYPHLLDGDSLIEILEFDVDADELFQVLEGLASSLLEPGYYAHVWSPHALYVCFPSTIVLVRQGRNDEPEHARRIGTVFGVPNAQMRFEEMFDTHHPDAVSGTS